MRWFIRPPLAQAQGRTCQPPGRRHTSQQQPQPATSSRQPPARRPPRQPSQPASPRPDNSQSQAPLQSAGAQPANIQPPVRKSPGTLRSASQPVCRLPACSLGCCLAWSPGCSRGMPREWTGKSSFGGWTRKWTGKWTGKSFSTPVSGTEGGPVSGPVSGPLSGPVNPLHETVRNHQ